MRNQRQYSRACLSVFHLSLSLSLSLSLVGAIVAYYSMVCIFCPSF